MRTPLLIPMLIVVALSPRTVHGDGGTVRLSERVGGYQITVMTAPFPLRAGPVDVSVFVVDAATQQPLPAALVTLHIAPTGRPDDEMLQPATRELATNKLFHAAKFSMPDAGSWQVTVIVDGLHGVVRPRFDLEVLEPLPRWQELWLWIAVPALPIGLYGLHQLVTRRPKGR